MGFLLGIIICFILLSSFMIVLAYVDRANIIERINTQLIVSLVILSCLAGLGLMIAGSNLDHLNNKLRFYEKINPEIYELYQSSSKIRE